jgi:hypothetical protein
MKRRPSIFFAADTATISPFAAPAGTEGNPAVDFNVGEYDAPEPSGMLDEIMQDTPARKDPPAKKPDAKPADSKPADQKPPIPEPKNGKDLPAHLRKVIEETKSEHTKTLTAKEQEIADLRRQLEESGRRVDPKLPELEGQLKTRETDYQSAQSRIKELEERLAEHDPLAAAPIREIQQEFDNRINGVFRVVPDLKPVYTALVQEFAQLDSSAADYPQRLREFKAALKERFGDDSAQAFGAVIEGQAFMEKTAGMQREIRTNTGKATYGQRQKIWADGTAKLSEHLAHALDLSDDAKATDPHNPLALIKSVEELIGKDEKGKASIEALHRQAQEVIRRGLIGFQPRSPEELAALPADQRAQAQQEEQAQFIAARQQIARDAYIGRILQATLRPFMQDYSKLREERARSTAALPPDPSKNRPGQMDRSTDGELDVQNYEPPEIMSERDLLGSR